MRSLIVYSILSVLLFSCGGGGDNSKAAAPTLQIDPSLIEQEYFEGENWRISFYVKLLRDLGGDVFVKIEDPSHQISGSAEIAASKGFPHLAEITDNRARNPGQYTGEFLIMLCKQLACTSQHEGSPVKLAYKINVVAHKNITPLSKFEGANDWGTAQGNKAHTGYIPVTLNPAQFSPRYLLNLGQDASVSHIVTGDDAIYFSYNKTISDNTTETKLLALNEAEGDLRWSQDFYNYYRINDPAYSGEAVYVATTGLSSTAMWSFNSNNGSQRFYTPFESYLAHYKAPVVDGETVYTNGGSHGGIYGFNTSGGAEKWYLPLPGFDLWSPAVDDENVYAFMAPSRCCTSTADLYVIDKIAGTIAFRVSETNMQNANRVATPMLDSGKSVFVINGPLGLEEPNRLEKFDIESKERSWYFSGQYSGFLAMSDTEVFAVEEGSNYSVILEVRDKTTGSEVWSWTSAGNGEAPAAGLIVTNSLVFLATTKRVIAIDKLTHQSVWTYPRGGPIVLSRNGILYVSHSNGISAINLH